MVKNNVTRRFVPSDEALQQLCLSVLHFGLRAMEHIFKIGFRKRIKQYKVYKKSPQERIMQETEAEIKANFKARGLPVFEVRENGE